MSKELILLEDVKDLGQVGDIVKVADGYARNYLLPRGFAVAVNKGTLRQAEARKLKLQKEREERLAVAKALAEKAERSDKSDDEEQEKDGSKDEPEDEKESVLILEPVSDRKEEGDRK